MNTKKKEKQKRRNRKRNPCKECVYYAKENGTCQSKKCSTGGYGYVGWFDRLFCKPNRSKVKEDAELSQT